MSSLFGGKYSQRGIMFLPITTDDDDDDDDLI